MAGRVRISDLRQRLTGTLGLLRENDQWIVITRYGQAAAALVSISLLRRALEATDPEDEGDMLEAKSAIRAVPADDRSGETSRQALPVAPPPDVDELLDQIDGTRRAVGLPPLDR